MGYPVITKRTVLEELKHVHQEIWNYVIEHGEKPQTIYRNDCVCCEYVMLENRYKNLTREKCDKCPILWPQNLKKMRYCDGPGGIYTTWHLCNIPNERQKLAKQIRDLPWKFESEENTPL